MEISIHALLAESDNANLRRHRSNDDFYPRSPCGERRAVLKLQCVLGNFYPRSPCGERLAAGKAAAHVDDISIHALLAESDVSIIELIE